MRYTKKSSLPVMNTTNIKVHHRANAMHDLYPQDAPLHH